MATAVGTAETIGHLCARVQKRPILTGLRSLPALVLVTVVLTVLLLSLAVQAHEVSNDLIVEPYLINHGFLMYRDIVNQHAPFVSYVMALLYRVVGYSNSVKVALLLVVGLVIALLTYVVATRLADRMAGLVALILFAMVWPHVGGATLWFDTFLPCLYLASLLLLVQQRRLTDRGAGIPLILAAGVMLGIAVLVKQQVILVAISMVIGVTIGPLSEGRRRMAVALALGIAAPLAVFLVFVVASGTLGATLYWLITYNVFGPYGRLSAVAAPRIVLISLAGWWFVPLLLLVVGWRRSHARWWERGWMGASSAQAVVALLLLSVPV